MRNWISLNVETFIVEENLEFQFHSDFDKIYLKSYVMRV